MSKQGNVFVITITKDTMLFSLNNQPRKVKDLTCGFDADIWSDGDIYKVGLDLVFGLVDGKVDIVDVKATFFDG